MKDNKTIKLEDLVIFLTKLQVPYEIEEGKDILQINFDFYDKSQAVGVEYNEDENFYNINGNKSFIDHQIKVLQSVRLLMDNFPSATIHQDHFGLVVFINK